MAHVACAVCPHRDLRPCESGAIKYAGPVDRVRRTKSPEGPAQETHVVRMRTCLWTMRRSLFPAYKLPAWARRRWWATARARSGRKRPPSSKACKQWRWGGPKWENLEAVLTYVKEDTDWPSVLSPLRREYTTEAESALTSTEPQNLIEIHKIGGGTSFKKTTVHLITNINHASTLDS